MSQTTQKLSIADASERLARREYPSLDQMLLYRLQYGIGALLEKHAQSIASGDETVKTALCGGRRSDQSMIISSGEVHALARIIDQRYRTAKEDADILMSKLNELLDGSELREELDNLGLLLVYGNSSGRPEDKDIGIGRHVHKA